MDVKSNDTCDTLRVTSTHNGVKVEAKVVRHIDHVNDCDVFLVTIYDPWTGKPAMRDVCMSFGEASDFVNDGLRFASCIVPEWCQD